MKKPQTELGQHWVFPDGTIVRITGWGQDGGGQGMVRYIDVSDPGVEHIQSGKGFRREASPVWRRKPSPTLQIERE